MNGLQHWRLDRDSRGVATATLDVQGAPLNVFNDEVAGELRSLVERLEQEPPRALVFRSGKPSGFLAGADVRQIRKLASAREARTVQELGQQLFDRIEGLPFPTIAVIHGPCLGGGLEFALACQFRVARADHQTKLGLPEVQLGIIPGWGGTQRLPRQVGIRQALRMILEGSTLTATKAATVGLVDLAADPASFEADVEKFVEDRAAGLSVKRPGRGLVGSLLDGPGKGLVIATARRKLGRKIEDYPALPAAIRAIETGLRSGHAAGLAEEREVFPQLLFGPVAQNLIELFLRREQARRVSSWVSADRVPQKIQKAVVVGGGVMGAGIAQLLALNGITVVLKEINEELAASGLKKVTDLTTEAATKGVLAREQTAEVLRRVTAAANWDTVTDADVAIEAVVEREEIKRTVFTELAKRLQPDAVLASNTSALAVTRLATGIAQPGRMAGLHFFNPVHRMQLVEVVRGRETSDDTIATLVELVRKVGKVPVVVADSPGFLVNRILFPYMDEAVRRVCDGIPGRTIDAEAKAFGMPMGPLELLDQVGIDVAADVATSLGQLSGDPSPVPERLATMAREGWLGKKSGKGFYEYRDGSVGSPTRWAVEGTTAPPPHEQVAKGELTKIQRRLLYPIINEAAKCLDEGVVREAWIVDFAMVLGTGFAPFRGGPLRTADAIGLPRIVQEMQTLQQSLGQRFVPAPLLARLANDGRGFYDPRPQLQEVH